MYGNSIVQCAVMPMETVVRRKPRQPGGSGRRQCFGQATRDTRCRCALAYYLLCIIIDLHQLNYQLAHRLTAINGAKEVIARLKTIF